MARESKSKKAFTLTEIMVVVLISSVIMGIAMSMMRRNNIQFKKSNDLINIQRLMDNIVERIRSDVRSLKKVNRCESNEIEFVVVKGGSEATITYEYNPDEDTFYRKETNQAGELNSDFHGSHQIISLTFKPEFVGVGDDEYIEEDKLGSKEFKCLNVAMQIASQEYGKKSDGSTLSIACQFYSTCVESEIRPCNL